MLHDLHREQGDDDHGGSGSGRGHHCGPTTKPSADRLEADRGRPGRRQLRWLLLEGLLDPLPQTRGRLGAAVSEQRRSLAVDRNERTRLGSAREVLLDLLALVVVYGVERVRAQELVELAATQLSCHGPATPLSTSASRSRLSPERIRLFTVPSGSPSTTATSR